jgi:hypothetical protein
MTEAEFQNKVIDFAKWCGWRVFHPRPAQIGAVGRWATHYTGDAGFPDLVMVHPKKGVVFAELKSDTGRVSTQQTMWLSELVDAGAEAYLWQPKHWLEIEGRLR